MALRVALALALAVASPGALLAQAGAGTDIVRGVVTDTDGRPLPGIQVTVTSLETGVEKSVATDERGRYIVIFVDGGGRYQVSARSIGYQPVASLVTRVADEDLLIMNLVMGGLPIQLPGLQVQARRPPPAAADPGAEVTALPGLLMQRLPLEGRDPTDLVALTPNAVTGLAEGSDSTEAEQTYSIGGGRTGLNRVTLDGLTLGSALSGGRAAGAAPWSVPPEAIRGTQVVASSYDVARGQFAGGQVASQTNRGTNVPVGIVTYRFVSPALQSGFGASGGPPSYSLHEVSGGFGGPISRNRSHYFVSLAARRRVDHPFALSAARVDHRGRILGVAPDSLARFLDLVERVYGVPAMSDTGGYDRPGTAVSGLGRFDLNLGQRHHLLVRGHHTWYRLENTRIGPFDLTHNGGEAGSQSSGGLVGVTSQLGRGFLNEFRAQHVYEGRPTLRAVELPQASVRVVSDLGDGTRGVATLVFGGERSLPTTLAERRLEATDELSLIWRETHRVKIGLYGNASWFTLQAAGNRLGTFSFNSLAAFENRQPASFTRTLDTRVTTGGGYNLAAYVGDAWRPSDALQLVYGLRWERDGFLDQPSHNPVVDSVFGLRTDRIGSAGRVSPRLGFTLRLSQPEPPAFEELRRQLVGRARQRQRADSVSGPPGDTAGRALRPDSATLARLRQLAASLRGDWGARLLRGGVGVFRGPPPLNLYAGSLNNTGVASSEAILVCTGSAVPEPDYRGYLLDPSAIPTVCAGPPSFLAARGPVVATFDPSFQAPAAVRATLGFQTPLLSTLQFGVDLLASWGRSLYVVRDVNIDPTPAFTLDREGGRPVFAEADAIVPWSGEIPLAASRRDPRFGQVLVLSSTGRSWTRSASIRVAGRAGRAFFSTHYTYSHTDDESSFSCCSALQGFAQATTAGDPNVLERAAANFDRRHSVALIGAVELPFGFQLTAVSRVGSGTPFTPIVGGDVNGDGARNDRAFVFDPTTTTDTALAGGMTRLLANASGGVRECIERQLGRIAARNSCRSPWYQTLDLRVSGRPPWGSLGRRMEVSVDFFNVLAGLDRLVHGDELKGWGATNQIPMLEPLLFVRGFDPGERAFRYVVNEAFGRPRWAQFGVGNPFQVQLNVRYLLAGGPRGVLGPGRTPGPGRR